MSRSTGQNFGQFWRDLYGFITSLFTVAAAKITGGIIAAGFAIYCDLGNSIPEWLAWSLVSLAFFSSAFISHRKQLRLEESNLTEHALAIGIKQAEIDKVTGLLKSERDKDAEQKLHAKAERLIVDTLGEMLLELQERRNAIAKINHYLYDEATITNQDTKIRELINRIIYFLDNHVGTAEIAIFKNAKPKEMPPQTAWDEIENKARARHMQYNYVVAHADALESIIKTRMETRTLGNYEPRQRAVH